MPDNPNLRTQLGPGTAISSGQNRWMNPLNKIKWRKAILAKKTRFTLDDGREFTLDYKRVPGKVLIKPVKGLVPMGWFDLERIERGDGGWIVGD